MLIRRNALASEGAPMRWTARTTAFVLCATMTASPWAAGGGGAEADSPAKQSGPYKDAMDAIKAERYAQAVPLLEKWVAQNSSDADGFNWLGFAYRKSGKLVPAFRAYKRALGLDPQHKGAHEYIGEAYLMAKQPDKAEEHAQILASLCPQSCEELNDLRAAITAYKANGAPRSTAKAP
jgi:tetratricopeptide (TPR) repeat protein